MRLYCMTSNLNALHNLWKIDFADDSSNTTNYGILVGIYLIGSTQYSIASRHSLITDETIYFKVMLLFEIVDPIDYDVCLSR